MEVSAHLKKKAKNYNVSWQFLVMADLLALGYAEPDAYSIAFSENAVWNVQRKQTHRASVMSNEKFQELLIIRKRELSKSTYNDEGDIELIGADETAREILKIARTMPEGSKERGEMFVRYADLIRKKDTQTAGDDDPIRIYLPMKCNICPFKAENEKKLTKNKNI